MIIIIIIIIIQMTASCPRKYYLKVKIGFVYTIKILFNLFYFKVRFYLLIAISVYMTSLQI
jgi:hypothetical protein